MTAPQNPVLALFAERSPHLYWRRVDDDHVLPKGEAQSIAAGEAYFVLRLKEMYLRHSRKLWRKFYPVMHAYCLHGVAEEFAVADPGHLGDIDKANLDRALILNQRLVGPIPFTGEDVAMQVGLYSVPSGDLLQPLLPVFSQLTSLGGPALAQVPQLLDIVKGGVDTLVGARTTSLRIGVRDTFYAGQPLAAGFYIGIAARGRDVEQLVPWISSGRFIVGDDPGIAGPYVGHDYLVVEVERLDHRLDWPRLPGIAAFEVEFSSVLAQKGLPPDDMRKQAEEVWTALRKELRQSRFLTQRDQERIANDVRTDVLRRLRELENPPEFRGGPDEERSNPSAMDFADIP
jgi:hypothetical protein